MSGDDYFDIEPGEVDPDWEPDPDFLPYSGLEVLAKDLVHVHCGHRGCRKLVATVDDTTVRERGYPGYGQSKWHKLPGAGVADLTPMCTNSRHGRRLVRGEVLTGALRKAHRSGKRQHIAAERLPRNVTST